MMAQQAIEKRPIPDFLQRHLPIRGEAALKKIARDGTLFVQGVPEKFPCQAAAFFLLHAAQDGGHATICIMKGLRHRHYFKVLDLVRYNARKFRARNRTWTGPALESFTKREDCWLDERRKIWQVGWQPKPDAKVLPATG